VLPVTPWAVVTPSVARADRLSVSVLVPLTTNCTLPVLLVEPVAPLPCVVLAKV